METIMFFDLLFKDNDVRMENRFDKKTNQRIVSDKTVAGEFENFFYSNGLTPLFTNEHRAGHTIEISLIQAQEIIKGKSHKATLLKQFGSSYLSIATDNKSYEQAVFKIIYQAKTFNQLIKIIEDHMNYIDGILEGYEHNTWNIVFYDKDKSGTKVSKGI